MRLRRVAAGAGAGVLLALGAGAPSGASAPLTETILAEGSAQAFTLRPQYDSGGAAPLSLYVGYTESNVSTPEPQADGQASWYNLGIAETAAFKTPEECTTQKNLAAAGRAVADVADWLSTEAIPAILRGDPPVAPGPHLPCTERFPGFAQSRYPETATIPREARDDLLTKPFCKDPGSCTAWTQLRDAARPVATDGSFSSVAGPDPSEDSAAALAGAGDGALVSVAFAQTRSTARLRGRTLILEATSILSNVCLFRGPEGCGVHIDQVRQRAVVEAPIGKRPTARAATVVLGMSQLGQSPEEAQSGLLGQLHYDYAQGSGEFHISAVSLSGGCTPVNNAGAYAIADAGGLRIAGRYGSGGSIMLGGACVRARISSVSLIPPLVIVREPAVAPPERIVISLPPSEPGLPTAVGGVKLGPPRVVTKEVVSFVTRDAPALRTAKYWASPLGALLVLAALGLVFRSSAFVRPVAHGIDRFARQFLRG